VNLESQFPAAGTSTGRVDSADVAIRANTEERLAALHAQVFKFTVAVVGGLGMPYFAFHAFRQWKNAELNFTTINVGIGLVCMLLGAAAKFFPSIVRRWLEVAGITTVSITSVFQDGPTLGVGLTFAIAVLLSSVLLGPTAAYGVGALLVALLVWFTLQAYGVIVAVLPTKFYLAPETWERSAITAAICMFALTFLFSTAADRLLRLLSKETVMRLRERQMEAERAQVLNSAAAIQRLESLGRLAGGVAHDFNNALVVIQCGVSELRQELGPDGPKEVLDDLNRGIERAASTAKHLLSFARRNVEEVGSCNPKEVVESLVRDAERILPAHVRLMSELELVSDVAMAASSLEQVLLNLIFNSRDAMPSGGEICIRLAPKGAQNEATLEVLDTGLGMDEATKIRAFDPFFTTKGDKGTGLGLAMVWGALNHVGGSVELDSAPERGTKITLSIPYAEHRSASAIRLHLPELVRQQGMKRRILFVEDEPQVQRAVERILLHGGYEVVAVSRVAEAKAALDAQEFDLLVTDGIVPEGGVGEFLREFQAKTWGAPVIVCSGYVEEDLAVAGISSGRYAFLAKPFQPDGLLGIIREQLVKRELRLRALSDKSTQVDGT
jgi:signal transduction histidine kinase/ActR/RegA family two-component response regulator